MAGANSDLALSHKDDVVRAATIEIDCTKQYTIECWGKPVVEQEKGRNRTALAASPFFVRPFLRFRPPLSYCGRRVLHRSTDSRLLHWSVQSVPSSGSRSCFASVRIASGRGSFDITIKWHRHVPASASLWSSTPLDGIRPAPTAAPFEAATAKQPPADVGKSSQPAS